MKRRIEILDYNCEEQRKNIFKKDNGELFVARRFVNYSNHFFKISFFLPADSFIVICNAAILVSIFSIWETTAC